MLIIVEDVNDNYPVFGPHRTAISIREDARSPMVIETLEASDADEGRFGQVMYKLDELTASDLPAQSAPVSSMFAIETIDGKGVISLIGQLDYEQRPLYQLRVLAIDRATEQERLSTSTSILISVEDCEDQAPMFTFAPSITRIPEDLPIGSSILRLAAIDGDRGVNNPIKYSIVAVNGHETGFERNLFSIGSDSGQLSVAHELDRELTLGLATTAAATDKVQQSATPSQPGAYVLQVRASEVSATAAESVDTELTIILTDVNDEKPQFNGDQFQGELIENSAAEGLVNFVRSIPSGDVGAKVFDRDQGTNGTFTLHLEGEHGHLFDVWPSEATNEASLMIKVSSLALQNSNNFKFFDYEKTKQLQVTLVAREKFPGRSSFMSSAQLVINLRDANDNYPQFDSELYRVEVPENAQRGMHICVVKALDIDSGPFGSAGVRYTEIRGERANKFKLDPQTGVITLRTNEHGFDRETIGQHHLIVEARDNLGQGNRNTTQLLIVLTDVNDQRPKFLLDQYEAFIHENELDFQSPLQVQAFDGDAPNSSNSRLTYSIVAGDPQSNFTIDPSTGRIKVRPHVIGHQAPPSGKKNNNQNGATSGSESDIVMVGSEAQAPSTLIGGLDFERIAQKRDETRQFNLTIRAQDGGQPEPLASTTQVLVLVYDKNDHAPVFTRSVYSASIREDAQAGSAVIQVQAYDGDHSPSNSRIIYRIASGASDKFVVDSDSGLVSVAQGANLDIDRVLVAGARRTNYLLNIIASDGSFGPNQKSSTTLVNITILDVNNKAPEFVSLGASNQQQVKANSLAPSSSSQMGSTVFVNEDAPFGLIVTRVLATDLDSSAELRYSINYSRSEARNEEMSLVEPSLYRDVFTIEPSEGTIKVSKQLDRELFDQVKLRLQVEDLAAQTSDQTSATYLTIKITDVNDNRPTFKRAVYKAVVNENSISGTSVITLTADDRDLNKTLRYSLEASSAEVARLLRVNPRSGEVTVNDKIDRELHPLINVTIRAEDFGQPHSLAGTCQLIVTVRDENDNNPIFLNITHLRPPTTTSSSSTNDANLPHNHDMASNYRHRSLDADLNSNSNGFEETKQQSTVMMDELGRELPLLAPGATVQIREDAPIGHQLAYVRAEDADVGNNGRVTYLLDNQSGGGAGKFRIDRDSGILSVAQPLDRELQRSYTLIIEASDNYDLGHSTGESRRAFTQVHVQVTDINDNVPQVSTSHLQLTQSSSASVQTGGGYPSYEEALQSPGPHQMPLANCLFINEFQPINEPILTLIASDLDDPDTLNGQLDLVIVNNLPQNELFSLVAPAQRHAQVQPLNDEPVSVASATKPAADLSGFGEPIEGSESQNQKIQVNKIKRSLRGEELRLLEPGNFYQAPSRVSSVVQHQQSSTTTTTTTTTTTIRPSQATGSTDAQRRGELQMQVVVSQSIREKVGNYTILVRATDRGQPAALSTTKMINVCVQDVNNHAPVFTRPPLNHTIRIMENATIGSFVTQVEASDLDHGLNGEVQYALKVPTSGQNSNQNDWQWFKIDRSSGVISTTRLFNRQLKKYYTLRVQAQDFGRPTSLSSDIDIHIMIVNAGKYQPEFERQQQALQFTENSAPGREWFTLLQTTNLDDDPALIHVNNLLTTTTTTVSDHKQQNNGPNGSNWMASPCYYIIDGDDHEQMFHLDRYTHKLTNRRPLDRERKANYTLLVQASNNCNQQPISLGEEPVETTTASNLDGDFLKPRFERSLTTKDETTAQKLTIEQANNWDTLVASDKSLLKVLIKVRDVNDNAPKFTQRVYTGGITTEADFGTTFMIVQAIDLDADSNGQVSYSIVRPIKRNLSLGVNLGASNSIVSSNVHNTVTPLSRQTRSAATPASTAKPTQLQFPLNTNTNTGNEVYTNEQQQQQPTVNFLPDDSDELFVISAQTGEISLNFDPQKHMKGYFEFEIQAKDPEGLKDSARVFIYLLRQDQRVKFVLRLTPQELRQRLNKFRSVMGNITGAIVNIDSYKYYENHDGTVDKKKTSLYLHFVNHDDNTIIEVDKVLTLIDNNIEYLDELYKEFHVLSSEAAHLPLSGSGALVDPIDQVRTGLMGISSFLALILILVIALCLNQRTRYERQLKAATVSAFGTSPLALDPDYRSQTNLPNTNLHSQNPNPIWISGHYGNDARNDHGHDHDRNHAADQIDWLSSGNGSPTRQTLSPHRQQHQSNANKRPVSRVSQQTSGKQQVANKQQQLDHHKLYHSGSSGVGMALDEDELDCLSSSEGDHSSDLNSLSGGLNSVTQLHYNATTATATPRDSLNSSHGQVSSSSGSNSASTTNERQALCSIANGGTKLMNKATPQQQPSQATSNKHHQTKVKLNSGRAESQAAKSNVGPGGTTNSTFGAFKEVTIYTESQRPQQHKSFNHLVSEQQQQQQHLQQPTSHVNRLASQFNAAKLQKQSICVVGNNSGLMMNQKSIVTKPTLNTNNAKSSYIQVHTNGSDVNQGIIKTTPGSDNKQQHSNSEDAKFVPANLQEVVTRQRLDQNVNNFETSLSKLSILNLETTEL